MRYRLPLHRTLSRGTTFLAGVLFCFSHVVSAAIIPLEDIAAELVAIPMTGGTSNQYSWWARYDIGFTQATGTFNIDLRIKLNGDDPGDALKLVWEQGIEDIWSGQFMITQENIFSYGVIFDVEFVDSYTTMHQLVTVHEGTGAANLTNWYTQNPSGWTQDKQDEAAAHEAGHMFGSYDEFIGGAVNPDGSYANTPDSVMGSLLTQTLYERNYQFIADWASGKAPDQYFAVSNSLPPPLPGVPLPPSILLFGFGLAWLTGLGKRGRPVISS